MNPQHISHSIGDDVTSRPDFHWHGTSHSQSAKTRRTKHRDFVVFAHSQFLQRHEQQARKTGSRTKYSLGSDETFAVRNKQWRLLSKPLYIVGFKPTVQLSSVYNSINQLSRIAFELPAAFHAANRLKAELVPDLARGNVCLVNQVED